ncbi:MAG: hypothetical protein ACOYB3_09875 [Azonexus sp.]
MAQNRQPPAFQEYAAAMMARVEFRVMTLAERGLLYTMRLECWVNRTLPENPAMLSKIIGFDGAQVASALPSILPFFAVENGVISCPELDDYRNHIEGIRDRQSAGGKQGAAITNAKSKHPETTVNKGKSPKLPGYSSGESAGQSRVEPRVLSPVQPSTAQPSHEGEMLTTEVVIEGGDHDF